MCGDAGAWAPALNGTLAEWVRLEFFDAPVYAQKLEVWEVNAAPFITRVVWEAEDGAMRLGWEGDTRRRPGVFVLDDDTRAIAAVPRRRLGVHERTGLGGDRRGAADGGGLVRAVAARAARVAAAAHAAAAAGGATTRAARRAAARLSAAAAASSTCR